MCGNGVRCVAKYVYDHGLAPQEDAADRNRPGRADAGIWKSPDEKVRRVRVDMGEPILDPAALPRRCRAIRPSGAPAANVVLSVAEDSFLVTCVSMGNPHCVMFVEDVNDDWVATFGPLLEINPQFPEAGQRRIRPGDFARRGRDARVGAGLRRDARLRHRGLRGVRRRRPDRANRSQDARPPSRRRPGIRMGRATTTCT